MNQVKKLTGSWVAERLPKRPKDANKGTFGKVLVIAGSDNYPGAAYLACAAAYRVGAGLVTLVTDRDTKIIISRKLPELTFLSYQQVFEKPNEYDVILIGPGLGQNEQMTVFIKKLLKEKLPNTVLDGDGLNILSKIDGWWGKMENKMILTPHLGEMSRLTGLTIGKIQADRENITRKFAKAWQQVVVLKGANTIIVSPLREVKLSPFANPLLATAGTGDVLAGVIAGLLAQKLTDFDAACVGVFIHRLAGEMLRKKLGDSGLLASDLLSIIPSTIRQLKTAY